MSKGLEISPELTLPIDAATQTFAFIARKGAGKTYAAGKLTECLLDAGVQCVVLDTVGNWYGLRLSADGKGKGFDIPVFGGQRGDIPLEAASGELVADLVIDTGRSIIVDLSQFSLSDRKRFATAFGIRLWQRKKAESSPSPLHLVIEESQLIIPQMVRGDDARMVGIYEEIIRLGRNYGIGVSMITQRPQSVNKEVLTQTECLIVLQVNGSPERKALKEWIVHQGMDQNLLDGLPGLHIGTAFVWSPQWLRVLKKVKIGEKRTFDASATPKVGARRHTRELAPLDLDAFKTRMAATIEKAKENDPAELKRAVADLKRKLQAAQSKAPETKPVEVPVLDDAGRSLLQRVTEVCETVMEETMNRSIVFADIRDQLEKLRGVWEQRRVTQPAAIRGVLKAPRPVMPPRSMVVPVNGEISGGLRRMMIALAQRPGLTKKQLGVRAGLSSTSGTFGTYLGRLRSSGWIEGGESLLLTSAGVAALGNYEPLPEGEELLRYWLNDLGSSGAGRMLAVLAESYPQTLTKEDLGQRASISHSSGTFGTYLGKLRTLELVEGRGELRASKEFFE